MKLLSLVVVLLLSLSCAHADDTVTLCPDPHVPDCVVPNWGQIDPEGVDSAIAPTTPSASLTTRGVPSAVRMTTLMTPVAMGRRATPPLKAVLSPNGLFMQETAALTTAIRRARFNREGTIVRGEKEIAAAAADAARRAGDKYVLTLYIKVSQTLKPDASALLAKKIESVNGLLSGTPYDGRPGKPKS